MGNLRKPSVYVTKSSASSTRADENWYVDVRLTARAATGNAVLCISLLSDFLASLDANTGISAEIRNAGSVHNAARSGTKRPGSRGRQPSEEGGNAKKSDSGTWKAGPGASGTALAAAYEVKPLTSSPPSAPPQAPAPEYQPGAVWQHRTTGLEVVVCRRDGPEVYVLGAADGISLFVLLRQYVYCGQTDGVRLVEG